MSYNDFLMQVFATAFAVIMVAVAVGFVHYVFKCVKDNWRD